MAKICFLGAGSTVFAKNVLGDCLACETLKDSHITLIDIDMERLKVSEDMLHNMNKSLGGKAKIEAFHADDAEVALKDADYVVNAIQVGGYKPSTVIDFEIPKKYGLRQTIADTLGVGGIFRALRTIPVVIDYCKIIEKVAPNALLLSYTNPMAMLTGALLRATNVRTVGLCHSVQACAKDLCRNVDMPTENLRWKIAGINHQAWLLEITRDGKDLYPEIKERAFKILEDMKQNPAPPEPTEKFWDLVRFELMKRLGYYITESSEHASEYTPWFLKNRVPELINQYRIPLDEYPRRCVWLMGEWEKMKKEINEESLKPHKRGEEYASYIFEAIENNKPYVFGGNVMNNGIITNLPSNACVEVACVADQNGVTPTYVGALPEQCAAMNRTNINPQLLAIEAALTLKKDYIYQAAMLDPHTGAELTIDEIVNLCDDLIEAHGDYLPKYK